MTKQKFDENLKYIEDCIGIAYNGDAYGEFSAELEAYTPAGEDMIINLQELGRDCFMQWIDDFDISYEVVAWWPDGIKVDGIPFDNIKEHYTDYEKFLNEMRKIAEGMPN